MPSRTPSLSSSEMMKRCIYLLLASVLLLSGCGAQTLPTASSSQEQAESAPAQQDRSGQEAAASSGHTGGQEEAPAPSVGEPVDEPVAGSAPEVAVGPEPAAEIPDRLAEYLESAGVTEESLTGQLLVVAPEDGGHTLYAYSRGADGGWTEQAEGMKANVGKNGVSRDKTEGDRKTPAGLFSLLFAFGTEEAPECSMEYRQVTENSYWVDDPASEHYNQWVELDGEKDWSSAEHLADYPVQYAYAVAVGYNTGPVIAGKGSAIFLHCGKSYTAGCVSVSREHMLELLQWLDPGADPRILILE